MVLPIALVTIGALLLISGFSNRSIVDIINGVPAPEDDNSLPRYDSMEDATEDLMDDVLALPKAVTKVTPERIDGVLVAGWIAEIVKFARRNGWTGRVTSGIRTDAQQRDACRGVCGNPNGCPGRCAEPGKSNHRGTVFPLGAVDVTDPAGFARAIAKYPGGPPIKNALGAQDPVHFSRSGK